MTPMFAKIVIVWTMSDFFNFSPDIHYGPMSYQRLLWVNSNNSKLYHTNFRFGSEAAPSPTHPSMTAS
jgi:hypothetical protein